MPGTDRATTVTTKQLRAMIELSPARLTQLENEGVIKRASRDRWVLIDTLLALIRFYRSDARRSARSVAEGRVRDARAEYFEVRTAEKLRQLVDIDDAGEVLAVLCGLLKQEIQGQPARVGGKDLALRRRLEDDGYEMLLHVSNALGAAAASLREGGEGLEHFLQGRGLGDLLRPPEAKRGRNGGEDENEGDEAEAARP
jgi:hypothetical protein